MKILFVINGLGVGGAERQLLALCSAIKKRGADCKVVSLGRSSHLFELFKISGIDVVEIGVGAPTYSLSRFMQLRKVLGKEEYDVAQGWMYFANALLTLAMITCLKKKPVFWGLRGMSAVTDKNSFLIRIYHRMLAFMSPLASKIVHNAQASLDAHALTLGYPYATSVVIPNGFVVRPAARTFHVLSQCKTALGIDPSHFIVGWVGRLHPHKDVPNLLAAAGLLTDRIPNVQFLFVGKGISASNRQLTSLISKHAPTSKITFVSQTNDVEPLMLAMDCLVISSRTENMPNTIGEAMSLGIPCAATNVGDCALLIGNQDFIVPAQNSALLAEKVYSIFMLDQHEREALGASGRQRIVDLFSIDVAASRYLKEYAVATKTQGI